MSEEVKENVVEEVVQPTETAEVQEADQEHQQPQKGSKEYNFRELEKRLEEERRQRLELENYVRSTQQKQQPVLDEVDDLDGIGKDDYLTRKQAEALASRKVQELLQEQEVATLEDRTRIKFRDYDDVVTDSNIKELIEDDRDLAESIKSSPNPYATAYKLIKKSAFYQGKSTKRNPDAEKLIRNTQKPVSSNAVQTRPLATATSFGQLSQQERNALWQEMQEAASRR